MDGLIFIVLVVLVAGLAGMFRWLTAPVAVQPDPWGEEVAKQLEDPDLPELCHRCLVPHETTGWFCPHCGAAVGPLNNWMPYILEFSQGEMFRAGVSGQMRPSKFLLAGYFLASVVAYQFFAPVYWYRLVRNWKAGRLPPSDATVTPPPEGEISK